MLPRHNAAEDGHKPENAECGDYYFKGVGSMEQKIYKKIGKSGGFTFPRKIREQLGFYPGTGVAIDIVDGKLVVSKSAPGCIICGSVDDLIDMRTNNICTKCAAEAYRQVN